MYSIPNNIQMAYAHDDAEHFACWERVFNSVTDLVSVIETAILIGYLIASFFTAGASLLNIPPTKFLFFGIKFFSPLGTIPISYACYPELIPPSVNAAGTEGREDAATVHLDCNDSAGFKFKEIKNDDTKWGSAFSVKDSDWGFIQPKVILDPPIDGEDSKNLPKLFLANPGLIVLQIMAPWLIAIIIALALSALGDVAGKAASNGVITLQLLRLILFGMLYIEKIKTDENRIVEIVMNLFSYAHVPKRIGT